MKSQFHNRGTAIMEPFNPIVKTHPTLYTDKFIDLIEYYGIFTKKHLRDLAPIPLSIGN